jgi:hypothetical protein
MLFPIFISKLNALFKKLFKYSGPKEGCERRNNFMGPGLKMGDHEYKIKIG